MYQTLVTILTLKEINKLDNKEYEDIFAFLLDTFQVLETMDTCSKAKFIKKNIKIINLIMVAKNYKYLRLIKAQTKDLCLLASSKSSIMDIVGFINLGSNKKNQDMYFTLMKFNPSRSFLLFTMIKKKYRDKDFCLKVKNIMDEGKRYIQSLYQGMCLDKKCMKCYKLKGK